MTFIVDGVECKVNLMGNYYQVIAETKDRIFIEVFDSLRDIEWKFKVLFRAAKRRLKNKLNQLERDKL